MNKKYSLLNISGKNAESFLQRQASNDITRLKTDEGAYVAFLVANGQIKSLGYLVKNSAEDFILVVNSDIAEHTKAHLEKFIITEEVSIELIAPNTSDNNISAALPQYESSNAIYAQQWEDICQVIENESKKFELENFTEGDNLIKLDLIDKYVSFEKGCFPGQETLSKYKNIGLKKREQRSKQYTEEALESFAKGNNQSAMELLRKAIKENPKNEDAYESLGVILGHEKRFEEAIKVMHQLEVINPNSIMAQTNLSIFYMKTNDKEKAEEHKAKSTVLQFDNALKK